MTTKLSCSHWLVLLTVTVFFSLGLVADRLANPCFYLLILIAITTQLFQGGAFASFRLVCRKYWPINLAMMGAIAAVFINQLSQGSFTFRVYDLPARLALFAVIFWIFLQIPVNYLSLTKWGWITGVLFCTIQLYLMDKEPGGRPTMRVWYIELVMLLGVFSMLSIGWNKSKNNFARIMQTSLQIMAGACGLYSAYLSETRGIWIAMPAFLLLISATFIKNWTSRKNFLILVIFTLSIGFVFSTTDIASKRITDAQQNIHLYLTQQNVDSPIGVRFQVWQGSWLVFKETPLFGVGREHYSSAMRGLAERYIITPFAAAFPHSHNEILYNMMTLGVVGLVGILLIYLVPAYYFARELRHSDREIRASAAMGLSICFGYMIFGLVDVMFMYKETDMFYSIGVALFLAHIINRKQALILMQ